MKTVYELINYRLPSNGDGWTRMTYQELKDLVETTQQDAFESGRAAQMRATADILMSDLPMTARSLRSHADQIDPTRHKSDVE